MRKEASTDSSAVETLKSSDEVTILSKEDNWYKVEAEVDGKILSGYIREDLLNIKGIGKIKYNKYGEEVYKILNSCVNYQ